MSSHALCASLLAALGISPHRLLGLGVIKLEEGVKILLKTLCLHEEDSTNRPAKDSQGNMSAVTS